MVISHNMLIDLPHAFRDVAKESIGDGLKRFATGKRSMGTSEERLDSHQDNSEATMLFASPIIPNM